MSSGHSAKKAVDIVVQGMVQGVGFRYRCKWKADELNLDGWAKNELDGTVSVRVQGMDYQIDSFTAWLRGDIRGVYISRMDVSPARVENLTEFSTF